VRIRPSSRRPNGSTDITVRDRSATRSLSRERLIALFGAGGAALRRCGCRLRLREWRLRTKLTAVLVVPLMLAGMLGALRVTDLVHKAQGYAALAREGGFVQRLGRVVYDLQGERQQVAAMLASAGSADRAALRPEVQAQVQRVDTAVTKLRTADFTAEALGPMTDQARPIVEEAYRAAVNRLAGLAALRHSTLGSTTAPGSAAAAPPRALERGAAARNAVAAYTRLIGGLLSVERSVLNGAPDLVARRIDAIKALSVAKEQASWQHAVLLAGILSGDLSVQQQAGLRAAEARFDTAADEFGQAMSSDQRDLYFNTRAVLDRKRLLDAALDRAVRAAPLETVPGDWNSAAAATVETMHQGISTLVSELRMDAQARGARAWREAFREGAAVTMLLLLAVALLVVVVRSLLQPLRTLRTAAFEIADRRLPQAVEQVLATDVTPAEATVDPLPVHSQEEVGQIARAFDTVHVQAVRLATAQAQLHSSLKEVFLTLSRRSQLLLDQQLQLIEELRGAARDPELVSSVRQLDRLAARMRRHRDNLLLLVGAPRRAADDPVPVLDVLNNALAEINEYQRVNVCPSPAAMVTPPVAGDLVHLIAELLDNATSVTPQGVMVTLRGVLTEDHGLLVEITDSGPGLPPNELQTINARLASAPETDASVSGQMGLLVVRKLAAQHGLTVRLRQRLGEHGITASAVLPPSLVMVDHRAPVNGGIDVHLPLQVSVVDETRAADLFSPSSISPAALGVVTSQRGHPRTAQEEWLELFGHHEPQPEPQHEPQPEPQPEPLSEWPGSGQAHVAAPGQPEEVREEIFEMVSAWFRERQSAPVSNPSSATASEWRSPLDEEWQAAQALRTRADHEFTEAGLPKRQPRAHLVSGADGRVLSPQVPACLARTPDTVRGQLTKYQRGLRVGRHARVDPDEQLAWTELSQRLLDQRPFDQRPFEENQQ
jgi:signal transduction histidine kinase